MLSVSINSNALVSRETIDAGSGNGKGYVETVIEGGDPIEGYYV